MSSRPVSRRSLLAAATTGALGPAALGLAQVAAPASGPTSRPTREPGTRKDVPPRMSFVGNDRVRVGMDLALGGAITHLSGVAAAGAADPPNLVNSWDLGRQIQMSYYSGPVPYAVPGHAGPPPFWRGIGWNPIQVGDDYGNPARVLEHRNDGRELYVRTVPMQWPLDDVPGECAFECWAKPDGPAVRVRCRLTMARADRTQWPARTQELPAVYTNGPWHRLFTYAGEKPFAGEPLRRVAHAFTAAEPWAHWQATERWAALVDDADRGVGVWNPGCVRWSGGFAGKPGAGGPKDAPTGYLAPNRDEVLDHDLVHEDADALVLGTVTEIRAWVYAQPRPPATPTWTFDRDRQGWHYRNARDAGWPIRGALDVDLSGDDGRGAGGPPGAANSQLVGPADAWAAADGPVLTVEAAFHGNVDRLAVYWATAAEPGFSPERVVVAPVVGDGVARAYRVELGKSPAYRGLVTQLRLDPQPCGRAGDRVRVTGVRVGRD